MIDYKIDYEGLFSCLPHNYFIVDIDVPRFTIIAASDQHLDALKMTREQVIGHGVFELFPDNPDNNYRNSGKLMESFMTVIQKKRPHHMDITQYDVAGKDGKFESMFWTIHNYPCFKDGKLKYIINNPSNITPLFKKLQSHEY